jgi:hypothetical protein
MGLYKRKMMEEMDKVEERAREHKIEMLKNGWVDESIFQLSNTMCEGGCGEYLTEDHEAVGYGMCLDCKIDSID